MEGEHTIIGRIPKERLHQIAARKLSALGIAVHLSADKESLEGEMVFSGRVLHPATGAAIARARFAVVGHDRLQFLEAPLTALGAVSFYDHERAITLEAWVVAALGARNNALQAIATRMRALRLVVGMDADRLAVRAVVKTPSHAFEILGGPDAVRVSRVAPVGGQPYEVATTFPPLDLDAHQSSTDLEIYLVGAVPQMETVRSAGRTSGASSSGGIEATAPPRNALTLKALAEVFGEDAMLAPNSAVELVREFQHGGTRYRFVAARDEGVLFRGRVIGPNGDVWSERFELAGFPGTERVVALALGASGPEAQEAPASLAQASDELPSYLLPHAGEVWVMCVVVEDMGKDEVRYVGTDIDGRPYGAARVLKRSDFEAVFSSERGGWRLLVLIDQLQGGSVIYRQLDRGRQPFGASKKMAAAVLVANFVPEAAAY